MRCEECRFYREMQIAVDDFKPYCGHRWHYRLDPDCGDYEEALVRVQGEGAGGKKARTQYVADRQEKSLEGRMEAARIVQRFRHAKMTPEEVRAEIEKDNDDLFGVPAERDGSAWKEGNKCK